MNPNDVDVILSSDKKYWIFLWRRDNSVLAKISIDDILGIELRNDDSVREMLTKNEFGELLRHDMETHGIGQSLKVLLGSKFDELQQKHRCPQRISKRVV